MSPENSVVNRLTQERNVLFTGTAFPSAWPGGVEVEWGARHDRGRGGGLGGREGEEGASI